MKMFFLFCMTALLITGPAKVSSVTIPLERTDLLALHGWASTEISVLGFHLGMSREEAFRNAKLHRLEPREGMMLTPCVGAKCVILSDRGLPVGIDVTFDKSNRIQEIDVNPGWGAPDARATDFIGRKLLGKTGKLVKHFDESTMVALLGPPVHVERDRNLIKFGFGFKTFEYPKTGLRIKVQGFAPRGKGGIVRGNEKYYFWEFYDIELTPPVK